ncbi:MAG: nitroreductase family protein [Fimbriimonadaceae bacterium]|nr:nitroreductase family protein [Fimbriimonadaceae bacterium]
MFDEPLKEVWSARYGVEVPDSIPDLGPVLTHRSVRDFAPEPVSDGIILGLIAAAQSAATSSNLQMWTAISVQDPTRRRAINAVAGDQKQISGAAWFFAFCADLHRIGAAASAAGEDPSALGTAEMYTSAVVDAALAGERFTVAAESLGLGCCYIGALRNHPREVARILELPPNVVGLFGLCLGWPAEDSTAQMKPRLRPEAVWHRERYSDPSPHISEYDARMVEFYESQGMNPGVNWSQRSGRRVGIEGIGTRTDWGEILRERGLDQT